NGINFFTVMKKYFFLSLPFLLLILIAGCSKNDSGSTSGSLAGNWRLTSVHISFIDNSNQHNNLYYDSIYINGPVAQFTSNTFAIVSLETGTYNSADNSVVIEQAVSGGTQ